MPRIHSGPWQYVNGCLRWNSPCVGNDWWLWPSTRSSSPQLKGGVHDWPLGGRPRLKRGSWLGCGVPGVVWAEIRMSRFASLGSAAFVLPTAVASWALK